MPKKLKKSKQLLQIKNNVAYINFKQTKEDIREYHEGRI